MVINLNTRNITVKPTEEQQLIIDAAKATKSGGIPVNPFIMIDAVAGSPMVVKQHFLLK